MRMRLNRFNNIEELNEAAAELLTEQLHSPGLSAVMLSGGQTPLPAYEKVASSWGRLSVCLSQKAHILFSDERMVPEDSPESNYANVRPMFTAIGISPERVIRVHTELALTEAAEKYDAELGSFLSSGGRITLGFLGLGADGHTASLFSPGDVDRGRGRWAIPVPRTPGLDRVSVTADLFREVDRIIFLVSGEEKAHAIARFIAQDAAMPAVMAVLGHPSVEVWTA